MGPSLKRCAAFAIATVVSVPASAQGIVTQKNISLALAQAIANAALAQCESMGFKVSVTVVDRAGSPLVMLRGDGSGLHTPEGSDRKAYTARTFSQPSAAFAQRLMDDPASVGSRQYTRVLALSGGAPRGGCRSKLVARGSAPSAFPAHRARTTSAPRPASTKWRIS